MSLVGTRPILPGELEQYELHHRTRIAIKPGITGMWQVSGRSDITDFEEVVRLDKEYIENWNMGLDVKILLQTMIVKKSFLAHEEYRYLDNVNFGNVYTFFRRYLQDFGAFGMAIMTIITSFIFSYMYNCKICGKKLTYRRMLTIIEYEYNDIIQEGACIYHCYKHN